MEPTKAEMHEGLSVQDIDALMKEYLTNPLNGRHGLIKKNIGNNEYIVGFKNYKGETEVEFSIDPNGKATHVTANLYDFKDVPKARQFKNMFVSDLPVEWQQKLGTALQNTELDFTAGIKELEPRMHALYEKLQTHIQQANEQAIKSGKPLLIVVGETHADLKALGLPVPADLKTESVQESVLVNLMVLEIAKSMGIKTMVAEADAEILYDMKSKPNNNFPTTVLISREAYQGDLKVIPGDPYQQKNFKPLRDLGILKTLSEQKAPALAIYGAAHLIDINNSALHNTHTLCLINGNNLSPEQRDFIKSQSTPEVGKAIDYAEQNPAIFQARLDGDIRQITNDIYTTTELANRVAAPFHRDPKNKEKEEAAYLQEVEKIIKDNKITLSERAEKELNDVYRTLSQKGSQLQSEEFSKQLGEFTAKVTPAVKQQIDSIKR